MDARRPSSVRAACREVAPTPNLTPDEIGRRVREGRVAVLATVDGDGAPHLVPVTYAVAGDTIYSAVDHKPKRSRALKRLDNIASDPRVTLLVHGYSEDWDQLWWCRLEGTAAVVTHGEGFERAIDALCAKYEQYAGRPPEGPAIVIDVTSAAGWRT